MNDIRNPQHVFAILPSGFFNLLAGGSNQELYSTCLLLIYEQFEKEISYRVDRRRIRDVLAAYLYDQQVALTVDDERMKSYADLANALIRKMASRNIGWLEEETDDATLEKAISMTEHGLALAEFLLSIQRPEKEEYSAYIIQIYNTLRNKDLWTEHPYINGLKSISSAAKALSNSLKKLSTYIRKIIERMILEESFESLTENLIEYFDGSFVREYARLTRQQNVYRYRGVIRKELEGLREKQALMKRMTEECALEEVMSEEEARERLAELFAATNRFLFDDYERIMRDIKHKITVYLQVGIGRARFLRNREIDEKSAVERTIRILSAEMTELRQRDLLPEEMAPLFSFDRFEYIDTASIRYPDKRKAITVPSEDELEPLTQEMIDAARRQQEKEAHNPYSREKMKQFVEMCMGDRGEISAEELPLDNKSDLMATLSAVAYARENGFSVSVGEGYVETEQMLLKRFVLERAPGAGSRRP